MYFLCFKREEPAMNLRKTCKKLVKYLPSNVQEQFSNSYTAMIDSLNEMDVVSNIIYTCMHMSTSLFYSIYISTFPSTQLALQRMQGSGIPAENAADLTFAKYVSDTIDKYEKMLGTLSSI